MAINQPIMGILENLNTIQNNITKAAQIHGQSVRLVAVSKTYDADHIHPVLEAGQRLFGENRVQEAKTKWPTLRQKYPDVELHLIGPLQSNKAADAVALFDVIQSVDREKIAAALAIQMREQNKRPKLYIQVNIGLEPQKAGIPPQDCGAFVQHLRQKLGLTVEGLMCIPPADEDPSHHFKRLKELAMANGLAELSMGMSGDYMTAIACGATVVRVGSAIFGARA